jgi:hypothetical protein
VSTTDPHRYDDAAYVLGALAPDERAAFEAHLATCAECVARVHEIDVVPALLAGIDEADLADLADEPMPDTLLPSLLRAANRQRRRQRLFVGSLAAVAAACAAALIVALWPASTSSGPGRRDFVAVGQNSPVSATATLTAKSWGTAIDVRCHYLDSNVEQTWRYALVVYDRAGKPHQLGDWKLPPDKNIDYQAGTSLTPGQITRLEITLPNGRPVLKLTT